MPDKLEVELKFAVSDPDAMRTRLDALGVQSHGRHHEQNTRLDSPSGALMQRDITLRVRTTTRNGAGNMQRIVTVKTPPGEQSLTVRVRREIEFAVSDEQAVLAALAVLGYVPVWKYEKYRENFTLDDVELSFDQTPIGTFIELEGTSESIKAATQKLELTMGDGIVESYAILFQHARDHLRFESKLMLFDELPDLTIPADLYKPFSQRQRLIAWTRSQEE